MKTASSVVVTVVLLIAAVPAAWGQSYEGALTLDPIPSTVEIGETIIFSGQLTADNGEYVVPERTVYIKDDVSFGVDTIIGSIVTDDNGEFSASWAAQPREDGGSYDLYAVFEGDSYVTYARSQTYSIYVQSSDSSADQGSSSYPQYHSTEIVLDILPGSLYAGETITFTGKLTSMGIP